MIKFSTFILVLLIGLSVEVFAQQEPQFSQNMFNILPINPGFAGSNDAICGNLFYRNQWTGFVGAPKTGLLNVASPVKMLHGGVGLTVFSDELGLDNTFGLKLAYSYHQHIGPGTLGVGVQAGLLNKTLEGSKFNAFVNDGSDQSIPTNDVSGSSVTLGFGLFYKTDVYYVGLSSTQLTESTVGYVEGADYNLKRHYYVTAGYSKRIGRLIELKPSLLLKMDPPVAPQIDLNVLAMYDNQIWGGVSYRVADKDAIVPLIGVIWNSIKVGYSYDITVSELRGFSSGTHEIMLGYCFKFDEKVTANKYRNTRFL
jgi:type IX secretion system PorP/SprF family membrane protein